LSSALLAISPWKLEAEFVIQVMLQAMLQAHNGYRAGNQFAHATPLEPTKQVLLLATSKRLQAKAPELSAHASGMQA